VLGGQCEEAAAVERLPKRSYPAEPRSGWVQLLHVMQTGQTASALKALRQKAELYTVLVTSAM